jgi:tRNA nucleotidyltransferase/poly(A) polymerase
MSDYMFMLESHLTGAQNRVVSQVATAAAESGFNVFLSGAAVRDMLGGFAVRELEFVVEGLPAKLVKPLDKAGIGLAQKAAVRKIYAIETGDGVAGAISMSRQERYSKTGARPQVVPAPIHEYLRCRDFTINAMALSLSKGSWGLLLDPTNGQSDLSRRELRAVGNYTLYDEPARLLTLLRLEVRLGFSIGERTRAQYWNAREAEVEKYIQPSALRDELTQIAAEPNPGDVVAVLERENLLTLFSPALTGAKVNHPGFQKLQKALQMVPYGTDLRTEPMGLFLGLLAGKLSAKERLTFAKQSGLTKADLDLEKKLAPRAKKLEKTLASAKLARASQVFAVLSKAPGDEILFLMCHSANRTVTDRIKAHLQRYLVTAQEVTDADIIARGGVPSTPKFIQLKEAYIAGRLDGRIRKPAPPPMPDPVTVAAAARRFN